MPQGVCRTRAAATAAYGIHVTSTKPGHRVLAVAVGSLLIALTAAGCSTSAQNGMGTITGTGDDKGLQFTAGGSTGDGADDVEVTVDHSAIDGVDPETTTSIVPWRQTASVYGLDKPKTVTMTVKSLAKNGWASCDITWSGQSISTKQTGKHAVAECVATLGYPDSGK